MRFYYFNSTHWDREWYQPFQVYRKYLCDTVSLLLDIFRRKPDYCQFTFDGQAVVLEDICQLRPSMRKPLVEAIQTGRLNVGPWYVMPDEFLCSTESLIRNLQAGRRTAMDFGASAAWPIGYVCDIFGHSSQMPQLLRGFGLDGAVVWRGFPGACGSRISWVGADGTAIPALRLPPHNGYANFTLEVRGWWNLPMDKATFQKRFREWVERYKDHFSNGAFVLSDALDHCQPTEYVQEIFQWIHELYPEAEIIHSNLTDFIQREMIGDEQLPQVHGERLDTVCPADEAPGGHNGLQICATLSSRYDVKLGNDQCQNLLETTLEPVLALLAMRGCRAAMEDFRYLWKLLLVNHAHDSICGCSIDSVHQQVLGRFKEVHELGECLCNDFELLDREELTGIPRHALTRAFAGSNEAIAALHVASDGCYRLRLFNPSPVVDDRVQEVEVLFPAWVQYPNSQAEPGFAEMINSFRLFDQDGNELPYAIKEVRTNQFRRIFRHYVRSFNCYRVVLRPHLVPGWNSVSIRPANEFVRHWESQLTGRMTAENGLLRLQMHEDGTYDVTDLRNGRTYAGQNQFRIDREIGDGWHHVAPTGAPVVLGGAAISVRLLLDSALRTEFEVVRRYELPVAVEYRAGLNASFAGIGESTDRAVLDIRTVVALEAGSDQLKVAIDMDNTIRDYRLRLAVPTGIVSGGYLASQDGTFIRRPDGRPHGECTRYWPEAERVGNNFDGILVRRDNQGGVALLAPEGLHEGGGVRTDGELFVTLMRCFTRTIHTNGEMDGELQGHREWRLELKFITPECGLNSLGAALRQSRTGLLSHILPEEQIRKDFRETLPALMLGGDLVLGAWKPLDADELPAEALAVGDICGAAIVRLYNYAEKSARAFLRCPGLKALWKCRLDEMPVQQLELQNCVAENGQGVADACLPEVQVEAAPAEMLTLLLIMG